MLINSIISRRKSLRISTRYEAHHALGGFVENLLLFPASCRVQIGLAGDSPPSLFAQAMPPPVLKVLKNRNPGPIAIECPFCVESPRRGVNPLRSRAPANRIWTEALTRQNPLGLHLPPVLSLSFPGFRRDRVEIWPGMRSRERPNGIAMLISPGEARYSIHLS